MGKHRVFSPKKPLSDCGAFWPHTSCSVSPKSAASAVCLAQFPDAGVAAGALRRPRPPRDRPGAGFTARARAASSAVCNPAGEEGIAATSQPGGFQRGGASRKAAALPAGARAHPPPRVPAAPGNVGHRAERPHVSPPATTASAPIM